MEASKGWWRDVTGYDPATSNERRVQHGREREDAGQFGGVDFTLTVEATRTLWTASVDESGPVFSERDDPPTRIPVLGQFLERQRWFRETLANWLSNFPLPVHRLAFIGHLLQQTDGPRAAYERLSQYLRAVDLDPATSDFFYRINRRRKSAVSEVGINRLTMWRAHKQAKTWVDSESPHKGPSIEFHSASFEFDVNTAPEFKEHIPKDRLPALFDELVDCVVEIAAVGDGYTKS